MRQVALLFHGESLYMPCSEGSFITGLLSVGRGIPPCTPVVALGVHLGIPSGTRGYGFDCFGRTRGCDFNCFGRTRWYDFDCFGRTRGYDFDCFGRTRGNAPTEVYGTAGFGGQRYSAMSRLCLRKAFVTPPPCLRYASTMSSLCLCKAFVMPLPCFGYAFAKPALCLHHVPVMTAGWGDASDTFCLVGCPRPVMPLPFQKCCSPVYGTCGSLHNNFSFRVSLGYVLLISLSAVSVGFIFFFFSRQ